MLKPQVTITVCCLYVLLAVGVSCLAILPNGKLAYAIESDTYYFAIRYGPGLVASVSTFLLKNTTQEFLRMLPYYNLADPKGPFSPRYSILARYWPLLSNPNTSGTWITFGLLLFSPGVIAYKALLFEVNSKGTSWELKIHTSVAIPLIGYYAVLAIYMLALTIWMWNRSTGLRSDWDPQCLADIISLFAYFDVELDNEEDTQAAEIPPVLSERSYNLTYRLGYWAMRDHRGDRVVYGIRSYDSAKASDESRSLSLRRRWRAGERRVASQVKKRGFQPYLFSPWTGIVYWICIVILLGWLVLCPLLLGSGFVQYNFALLRDWSLLRADKLANGTYTVTGAATNVTLTPAGSGFFFSGDDNISTQRRARLILANFLLRFLPTYTLSIVALQMSVQDSYHRFAQPLYNMSQKPSLAMDSLPMDYLTKSPFQVTLQAFQKRQWKVFVYSLLGSAPEFLMLLPYGLLTLVDTGSFILCQFSIPAASGTCVLIILWLTVLLSTWPTQRRRVPRLFMSLLDIWSLFHKSHFVKDACYSRCEPHWTKQHLHGEIFGRTHRYLLGRCKSEDGKVRIGVDVCKYGPAAVTTPWVHRVRPKHLRFWKNRSGVHGNASNGIATDPADMEMVALSREEDFEDDERL
jgi:hypothetical protein